MSKFWGGGSDSEEDEIEDEIDDGDDGWGNEGDDDEGGEDQQEEQSNRAYIPSDSDSDDEEEKRVVKSARRKRYDELQEKVDATITHVSEKDFDKMWDDMNGLDAWVLRSRNIVEVEGLPWTFFDMLVRLEDVVAEVANDKEVLSGLNKTQAKAFNRLKKALPKHNKEHADKIAAYRENPDAFPEINLEDDWAEGDDKTDTPSTEPLEGGDWQTETKKKRQPVKKAAEPEEWTDVLVEEHLDALVKQRGRKKTDKKEQIAALKKLLSHAESVHTKAEVTKQIIASQFEFSSAKLNKHMKPEMWNAARAQIQDLLALVSTPEYPAKEERAAYILRSFVDQLAAELTKSLQNIDPHTHEYVDVLKSETHLLEVAAQVQSYLEKLGAKDEVAHIAMKRIEHIYYKLDTVSEKLEVAHQERKAAAEETKPEGLIATIIEKVEEVAQAVVDAVVGKTEEKKESTTTADLDQLCAIVYAHGDKDLKVRAMLCQVYHRALHDKYHQARDMVLMYHLQDDIMSADINTQILFNRTMAQLGLCAFRKGYIAEAHSALADIATSKVREYLAQGILNLRYGEKNPEQEKLERQRQVPYHMHINLELLEAVHLIAAMLLEVPNLASRPFEVKPKYISRAFGRLLTLYERQVFTGPPETTRDFVLSAAKALEKGDWKKCEELLLNLPVWEMMHSVDQVKVMLRSKIQEAGLRTYLFTYGQHYDSLSLSPLCIMFDIPHASAHSIVSKMMFNEELHASWDQPTGAIIMHKTEPSRLQFLALQYAEKLAFCVENNERILDARTGAYKYEQGQKPGQKDNRGNQRNLKGGQRYNNNQQQQQREHREPREHQQRTGDQQHREGQQGGQHHNNNRDNTHYNKDNTHHNKPRQAWGGQQGIHRSDGNSGGGRGNSGGGRGGNSGGGRGGGRGGQGGGSVWGKPQGAQQQQNRPQHHGNSSNNNNSNKSGGADKDGYKRYVAQPSGPKSSYAQRSGAGGAF